MRADRKKDEHRAQKLTSQPLREAVPIVPVLTARPAPISISLHPATGTTKKLVFIPAKSFLPTSSG